MWNADLYLKTLNFAAEAHAGQLVTDTKRAYITHVSSVAAEVLVALSGANALDIEINLAMQGALLHDVLEDTDTSESELEKLFGTQVLSLVQALTKDATLPKADQMKDSLARILRRGKEARVIKMADRIVNLQPPPSSWTSSKCLFYRDEARLILETLKGVHDQIEARFQSKINNYLINE
jgi:guanosine-3',5'-bis(diphosphate) 3'-pyrophosphohydrolase